jgi:regulator of protease activity HflC (stomatin/prohibitin superfamily)
MDFGTVTIPIVAAGAIALITSLRVLMEYERGVIFRLGKLTRAKGPG